MLPVPPIMFLGVDLSVVWILAQDRTLGSLWLCVVPSCTSRVPG
jgi:hypothetical protein